MDDLTVATICFVLALPVSYVVVTVIEWLFIENGNGK